MNKVLLLLQAALGAWVIWEAALREGGYRLPPALQTVIVLGLAAGLLACPWRLVVDAASVAAVVGLLHRVTSRDSTPIVVQSTMGRTRPGGLPDLL